MTKIHISELLIGLQDSNFLWLIIPIFFIGVITDKYQEEFKTSVGNAISNGALIIFTGFSWLQIISTRENFPQDIILSQILFSIFVICYGFSIIASGFRSGEFARVYGRIRVITFMLMFFTMMITTPILYNFISILLFVLLFPFYYAFITELIKIMPNASNNSNYKKIEAIDLSKFDQKNFTKRFQYKIKEYLK